MTATPNPYRAALLIVALAGALIGFIALVSGLTAEAAADGGAFALALAGWSFAAGFVALVGWLAASAVVTALAGRPTAD